MRDTPSFGQWFGQRRKVLGLTQQELAERMSCSGSLIRKLEAGQRVPSVEMAEQLAALMGVAPSECDAFVRFARGRIAADKLERELWQTLHSHTATPHPTNLHLPLTTSIGREKELESLRGYLLASAERLVTVTGSPGIGKTRLATEAGIALLEQFEDGVFFVSLAPIRDPDLVPAAIAQVLGVRDTGTLSLDEHLAQFLREKSLLLVLDNFEQVLNAAPSVVNLLEACPQVKALVTSREALHTRGERIFRVPPLQLPDLSSAYSLEIFDAECGSCIIR